MPTYNFYNIKTKKSFMAEMKISEREEFLKSNPHIQQTLTPTPSIDPYVAGRKRTDSRFRDRLQKIKENNHGSTIRTDNLTAI
jgi:hypothetical protein